MTDQSLEQMIAEGRLAAEQMAWSHTWRETAEAVSRLVALARQQLATIATVERMLEDACELALKERAERDATIATLTQRIDNLHEDVVNRDKRIERLEAREKPPALDDDLREILGMPNFVAGPIAHVFQTDGADIPRKSEAEQAYVIHWLFGLYLKHGSGWRAVAGNELGKVRAKIRAALKADKEREHMDRLSDRAIKILADGGLIPQPDEPSTSKTQEPTDAKP